MVTTLLEATWRERAAAHEARVPPWVEPRLIRLAAGESDPVDNFGARCTHDATAPTATR